VKLSSVMQEMDTATRTLVRRWATDLRTARLISVQKPRIILRAAHAGSKTPLYNLAIVEGAGRRMRVMKLGTREFNLKGARRATRAIYQWLGFYTPLWSVGKWDSWATSGRQPEVIPARMTIRWAHAVNWKHGDVK
jgi:hypothetical protein